MKKSDTQKKYKITTSDYLAITRTKLANERTFLAYFRTFAVLFSSGFVLIKIEALNNLLELGYFFVIASITILVIGIARFFFTKISIRKMFKT